MFRVLMAIMLGGHVFALGASPFSWFGGKFGIFTTTANFPRWWYNPTLPAAGRVAIVLRGRAFRCKKDTKVSGIRPQERMSCCEHAVHVQEQATASLVKHVIQPLEVKGNKVEVVVTDEECHLTEGSILSQLTSEHGGRTIRFEQWFDQGNSSQGDNIRFALETFKELVPGGSEEIAKIYDLVLVLRHDTIWKQPIDHWPDANFSKFNFPSRCEYRRDFKNCSSDIFHIMRGSHFPAFDSEVGTKKCFDGVASHGHNCTTSMWDRLGRAEVGFATQWRPAGRVREPNELWELYDAAR